MAQEAVEHRALVTAAVAGLCPRRIPAMGIVTGGAGDPTHRHPLARLRENRRGDVRLAHAHLAPGIGRHPARGMVEFGRHLLPGQAIGLVAAAAQGFHGILARPRQPGPQPHRRQRRMGRVALAADTTFGDGGLLAVACRGRRDAQIVLGAEHQGLVGMAAYAQGRGARGRHAQETVAAVALHVGPGAGPAGGMGAVPDVGIVAGGAIHLRSLGMAFAGAGKQRQAGADAVGEALEAHVHGMAVIAGLLLLRRLPVGMATGAQPLDPRGPSRRACPHAGAASVMGQMAGAADTGLGDRLAHRVARAGRADRQIVLAEGHRRLVPVTVAAQTVAAIMGQAQETVAPVALDPPRIGPNRHRPAAGRRPAMGVMTGDTGHPAVDAGMVSAPIDQWQGHRIGQFGENRQTADPTRQLGPDPDPRDRNVHRMRLAADGLLVGRPLLVMTTAAQGGNHVHPFRAPPGPEPGAAGLVGHVTGAAHPGVGRGLAADVGRGDAHRAHVVPGAPNAVLVRVATGAQAAFLEGQHQQLLLPAAMHPMAGLANHAALVAQLTAGRQQGFGVSRRPAVQGMVAAGRSLGPIGMAEHAQPRVDVLRAQKDGRFLVIPFHAMGRMAGPTVDLAIVVQGQDFLAVHQRHLHVLRRLHPDRVEMVPLGPDEAGIEHETVVTGETHALGAHHVLTPGGHHRLRVIGNQRLDAGLLEIGEPHDVADGAFPFG